MYIAYGSAQHPDKASTNLHLDISDAVNVMCYCGVPKDGSTDDDVKGTPSSLFAILSVHIEPFFCHSLLPWKVVNVPFFLTHPYP